MSDPPPSYSQIYPDRGGSYNQNIHGPSNSASAFPPIYSEQCQMPHLQNYSGSGEVPRYRQSRSKGTTDDFVLSRREAWFQLCKYYVFIVNCFTFCVALFLFIALLIATLLTLVAGESLLFLLYSLVGTLFAAFVMLYLLHYPIRGSLNEDARRLIVHGMLRLILLLFHVFDRSVYGVFARHLQHDLKSNQTKFVYSRKATCSWLIFGVLEVMASLTMGFKLHREAVEAQHQAHTEA